MTVGQPTLKAHEAIAGIDEEAVTTLCEHAVPHAAPDAGQP
jgi:hypothetical protein